MTRLIHGFSRPYIMHLKTLIFCLVVLTFLAFVKKAEASVSASQSTVSACPTSAPADDLTISTITVTLKDNSGNSISGKAVTLSKGGGSSLISPASSSSGTNEVVTFTISDAVGETGTYTTDSIVLSQTAGIMFTAVPWYNQGWLHRLTIQTNLTNVSALPTNFPVLINNNSSQARSTPACPGRRVS